jgi:hypothetical protein
MTHEQLMERHKVRSNVSDLNAEEREVYEAFLELAQTKYDVDILSRVWLKMHHRGELGA